MKRLLLAVLSVAFAFTLVFGLTACKDESGADNGGATEQTFTVTYNYDGTLTRNGVQLTAKTETVKMADVSAFTLPVAEKRGYTFTAWQNGGVDFNPSDLNGNVTLTPKFTVNEYAIIYDFDGDVLRDGVTLTAKTEAITFETVAAYKTPVAYKKGYTFKRWVSGGAEFDKSVLDASATYTLTPEFSANGYTFIYDYEGAVSRGGVELIVKRETVTADKLGEFDFPVAVKAGNAFNGWTVDGALFDKNSLDKTASVTLTPAFTANTYKVRYYFTEADATENTDCLFEDSATYGAHYTVKNQQDLLEKLEKIDGFDYDIIGWKVFGGDAFVSGEYTVEGDAKLVPVKPTETGDTFNLTVKVGTQSKTRQIVYGASFTLPDLSDYGLTARTGYRYAWVDKNGSEVKSGVYSFKYSLVVTATEVKNKATVNFVVGPAAATDKLATLTTVTAELSTGDKIPQAVYSDNTMVINGKIYVYKFAYWTLDDGKWSGAPLKAYDDNGEIVIGTDGDIITLYAYFTLAQETPNK